ncbi:MAG TPA: hypothetical protein VH063_16230 [Gaiellaceae bacterium]|jgi:hypothetical protein|nr:hypothetical protein [Gaiellaceae bacterium]
MQPHAEFVHWFFASGVLLLGLVLVAQAVVGDEVWRMRRWRIYLWPGIAFGLGVLMWPVMTFFTNSAIHMVAHGIWAQALMVMGAAELGLAKGKLKSRWWRLAAPVGIALSGAAFLVHEQNSWYFARAAFLHHLLGWALVGAALFPLGLVFRPRSMLLRYAFGACVIAISVMLFSDRDIAPIFGHLSPLAGVPHR